MSIAAIVPVAHMAATNASLSALGRGEACFSAVVYTGDLATHGLLHAAGDPAFEAEIKASPNVTWSDIAGSPADRVAAVLPEGAQWAGNIEPMEDAP